MEITVRNKRNWIKFDPNFLSVLLALPGVCSTGLRSKEMTNGICKSEDSSAGDFAAGITASEHFN